VSPTLVTVDGYNVYVLAFRETRGALVMLAG
jgi:hypothetical protein